MLKRTGIILAFACAFAVGLAIQATPASAQETAHYTYVSEWTVPRTMWAQFDKERAPMNATLASLVADGTIIDYGTDDNMVHTEDGYTQESWFTATSREGILKALELLRPMSTGGAFASVTHHRDFFMRTLVHGGNTSPLTTGYLRVADWQAKPGDGGALETSVKKYILPVLDAEIASGTVLMYNFDEEELHTDPPGAFFLAILYPSAAAMDKGRSEIGAMEHQNPASEEEINNLTIVEMHRDELTKVSAYQHK
jgi:hypothetical protein